MPASTRSGRRAATARKDVTQADVVATADRLARRHGMDALTIRALCDELGVTAPTIYWHVASKDGLIALIVDRVFDRIDLPGVEAGNAMARVRTHVINVHDEVARYPGLAGVIARELPTPAGVRHAVEVLALLHEAGFSEALAMRAWSALTIYLTGHLLYADRFLSLGADVDRRARPREPLAEVLARRSAALESYPDVEEFRRLMGSADTKSIREQFVWGLDRLLAGLDAELGETRP